MDCGRYASVLPDFQTNIIANNLDNYRLSKKSIVSYTKMFWSLRSLTNAFVLLYKICTTRLKLNCNLCQ